MGSSRLILLLALGLSLLGAAELAPTPTELTLLDGRKVPGQLVGELEQHLILYSPGMGVACTFEKRFVASYTKDKAPVKLNEPRPLTPDELHYMNWQGWPDAAPIKGPAPAYAKQQWEKPKRLMVWAKPGEAGDFSKTDNWVVFGAAPSGSAWWDEETDILLPSASASAFKPYKLNPGTHPELPEGRMTITVRHIVVERGAYIQSQGAKVFGNEWVRKGGRINMRFMNGWFGGKNTLCRVDAPMVYLPGVNSSDVTWGLWSAADKERLRPESEQDICQYLTVEKDAGASVEFLGVITSRDKIQIVTGMAIAGPDSQIMSDNRNGDHVHPAATLALMDGALWGKRLNFCRPDSIEVQGTLWAGLPDRPLTRDATLLLNMKDYTSLMSGNDRRDAAGLRLHPKATMRVHSSDPTKARLVIRCGRCDTGPGPLDSGSDNSKLSQAKFRWQALPQYIDVLLLGDAVLDGVVFEDLWKGGVRFADLTQKDAWKNITFAPSCQSQKPEDCYGIYTKNTPPSGWSEDPAVKTPPALGEPEPACEGNAEVATLREAEKAADAKFNQANRAYKSLKGDDEAIIKGMVAMADARWELWKTQRAKWLAIIAAQGKSGK